MWPFRKKPRPIGVKAGQAGYAIWWSTAEEDRCKVHPADIAEWEKIEPNQKVFLCESIETPYVVLRYGSKRFRVMPELFRPVPTPRHFVGDRPILKEKGLRVEVLEMGWHFKKSAPMYFIQVDGKKKSRRYWEDDFE